jgi:hypothetical protein
VGYFVRPEALDSYATLVERNGINLSLTNVHLGGETELGNVEGSWGTSKGSGSSTWSARTRRPSIGC